MGSRVSGVNIMKQWLNLIRTSRTDYPVLFQAFTG